jgi:glycerol-3-phosphate dehydrogenase
MNAVEGAVRAPVIDRSALLARLREDRLWDVLVIGGGATGLGIAVDAAARGLSTVLIEARDFAAGTSSRSTKLIHGGVRYLAQGNVKLVREALTERATLIANAPELVHAMEFVVPCYRWHERAMLRVGLGLYDTLAGARGIGPTEWLSPAETLRRLPTVRARGLHGGVSYWDAQFDDARLAIALMRTACRLGAVALNYLPVHALQKDGGRIVAARATDAETGEAFTLRARAVFNASGVWGDAVRRLAEPTARPLLTLSRGSHIVVGAHFLPGARALMIPKTADGRVLFAIPWQGRLVVGTTDVACDAPSWEPQPTAAEVDFIVETARGYLAQSIGSGDILATYAGLRPLVAAKAAGATRTLSREHAIIIEHGNLLTIAGGKWTTYRRMALDAVDQAIARGLLVAGPSTTSGLRLDVDAALEATALAASNASEPAALLRYGGYARAHEQARTIEDLLCRRLRIGLVDTRAAARLATVLEGQKKGAA